jgi:hypothetical protein
MRSGDTGERRLTRELAAPLFIESSPAATAVQVVYEFIAAEIREGPWLVDVLVSSPYV